VIRLWGGERQNNTGAARIIRKRRPIEDDEGITGPLVIWRGDRKLFLVTATNPWDRPDQRGSHDAIGQRKRVEEDENVETR